MQRLEAKFVTKHMKWMLHEWPDDMGAYLEHKVARTNSLLFSAVSEKQRRNLNKKKFIHKFSDFDRLGTPLDAVCFCGKGYVVIQYHKPGNKEFFMIPIITFLLEEKTSVRKSLTEDRAREISIPNLFLR